MNLPSVTKAPCKGKKVLVRVDFDVPLDKKGKIADNTRIEFCLPTLRLLLKKEAKIILISHLGRPERKRISNLSLKPIILVLEKLLGPKVRVHFSPYFQGKNCQKAVRYLSAGEVLLLENLRFSPDEEENNPVFAHDLASLADIYINEAFANSHRAHASIIGLPNWLPSYLGLRFAKEFKILSSVYQNSKRPIVLILGGKKESKILSGQILLAWVDTLLVGGQLVEFNSIKEIAGHTKVKADLTKKGEDITSESARQFAQVIKKAGTIIWSGPMGAYENPRYLKGTEIVAKAVVSSEGFSVVGGGDTEAALTQLGLEKKVDFISSGGGAMLDFFAQRGTLPGIEAIKKSWQKIKENENSAD